MLTVLSACERDEPAAAHCGLPSRVARVGSSVGHPRARRGHPRQGVARVGSRATPCELPSSSVGARAGLELSDFLRTHPSSRSTD
eukprot:5904938-Prymnesium_polylepis.1